MTRDERGSATPFVVGLAITLVVMAGLVADGGGALNARMRLADDVEHAAIAGAQATDEAYLRATGELRIDKDEAVQRIQEQLAGKGYQNIAYDFQPDAAPTSVEVHAELVVPTKTLSLIGLDTIHVSANARSEAEILP